MKLFYMNTDTNKQLLWKLLYDKHYFNKFENSQFNNIKDLFDKLIIEYDNKSNDTILEKNKKFIHKFISELNTINVPYKREDIINTREQDFFNNLNKKTKEFNEFKQKRPAEINFSDPIEDTPINLLDTVSQFSKKRETNISIQPETTLQEILNTLKTISKNQQEIIEILNKHPLHKDNDDPAIENIHVETSTDLIDINE